jgi:hypothetical protein
MICEDLEDLQHHEAAHYAMAQLTGLPVVAIAAVGGSTAGVGCVLHRFHPHSRNDAVRRLMVTLSGLLEQLDLCELEWGRLDPQRSLDERQVVELVEHWRVSRKTYNRILSLVVELRCRREFDRLKNRAVVLLDRWPVVHEQLLEELAA